MYRRNDTQDFMDAVLTDEDHAYIMREARKIDSDGLERLRRQEIVDFRIKTADMNKAKALAAARKALETRRELRKLPIITSTADLSDLTIPKIHLQLNALRLRGVPNILPNSRYTRKPAKLEALEVALTLYLSDLSKFPLPLDPEADLAPEMLTVDAAVVDDWVAEEDVEMEE
jgi:CheY-like chemotaxis protein